VSFTLKYRQTLCILGVLIAIAACEPSDNANEVKLPSVNTPLPDQLCSSIHPTKDEIPEGADKSPRPDGDAEVLAFEAACTIAATDAAYDRVTKELAVLRTADPDLQQFHPWDGQSVAHNMNVDLDSTGGTLLKEGSYNEWDALNTRYGALVHTFLTEPGAIPNYATLSFKGTYNGPLLTRQYRTLPHVINASVSVPAFPALFNPDAAPVGTVCLAIDKDNGFHYYMFVHKFSGYSTVKSSYRIDTSSNITELDTKILIATSPAPSWLQDCLQWLY